jgi:hypothetical protein
MGDFLAITTPVPRGYEVYKRVEQIQVKLLEQQREQMRLKHEEKKRIEEGRYQIVDNAIAAAINSNLPTFETRVRADTMIGILSIATIRTRPLFPEFDTEWHNMFVYEYANARNQLWKAHGYSVRAEWWDTRILSVYLDLPPKLTENTQAERV